MSAVDFELLLLFCGSDFPQKRKFKIKDEKGKYMFLLHAHAAEEIGGVVAFLEQVVLSSVIELLTLLPFLFLTYLLMEFIEHRASDKAERFMKKAGPFGPAVGGLLGAVPQCGFSAAASNLFAGRVVTVGTLIAVFLSTSDEMLPILISSDIPIWKAMLLVLYKVVVAVAVGFFVDILLKALNRGQRKINIDELCEKDECHCEKGILHSAIHHTITISLFVFAVTFVINTTIFFIGEERLGLVMNDMPVLSHIVAAVVGLVPNCASSVLLATLYSDGIISVGTMLSGLFSGAGVGLLVLFRVNRHLKENLLILLVLVLAGVGFGLFGEVLFA